MSAPTTTTNPGSETVLTPTVGRVLRRSLFWVAAALVATFVVIAVMVGGGGTKDVTMLSAANASPTGAKALVEVLRQQGVTVVVTDSMTETLAAVDDPSNTSVFVYDRDFYLTADLRDELVGLAENLVFLEPGLDDLEILAPGIAQAGDVSGELDADCAFPAASAAEQVTGDGRGYRAIGDNNAITCFPSGKRVFSLIQVAGDDLPNGEPSTVTALGTSAALTNERVGERGNAALGLTLLGEHDTLVWYIPTIDDQAGETPPTLGELSPDWVIPAALLALLVFLAAAFWRGRRLGPLVVENLPVTVRASETMRGRARLYERSSARLRALDSLRIGTISRVARSCGLPTGATVVEVVGAASALLRRDPQPIRRLLIDAEPASDGELVALSDELLVLERAVAAASRPA
jgi:hypothetical protein